MHPHRSSALGYASAASALHSRRYGACSAEAAASETSGLSVGGCIRARGYFGPYPVETVSSQVSNGQKTLLEQRLPPTRFLRSTRHLGRQRVRPVSVGMLCDVELILQTQDGLATGLVEIVPILAVPMLS